MENYVVIEKDIEKIERRPEKENMRYTLKDTEKQMKKHGVYLIEWS